MMWRLKSRKLEKKLLAIDPEFLKILNKRFNRFDRKNRKQWPWCDTIPLLYNNGFWRLAVLIRKEDVVFTSKFDKEIPSSCDSKMETKAQQKIDIKVKQTKCLDGANRAFVCLSSETNLLVLTPQDSRKLAKELLDKAAICALENGGSDGRTI